jgi:tetratricopeptide (TPR) repeat protein
VNCHMTSKTYMGIDLRRDHSFRIPRPDQSEIYKTPNACNSCHTAKSAKWAATAIEKWYGPVRQNHFSDDLLPGSLLNKDSESHLVKLLNDTLQPVIARATAAGYLGELTGKDCANALMFALRDKEALIRYMALRSLENYTSEWWRYEALKLLKDPVRAVRIAAASLFHRLNPSELQSDYRSAYLAADNENLNYLRYQSDFALGNVMLADYYLQGGDYRNAVSNYLRGLKKDNQMNYARLNLSAAYSALGNSQDALKTLNEAMDKDPKNDRIFYNLGLLYYEMQDTLLALKNFKQAQSLGSTNPALYYNYGLLLIQQKRPKEAEQVLLKGFELNPGAGNINYALAYLFTDQKQVEKARKHAVLLKQIDPKNPQYQPMFKAFGM